MLGKRQRSNSGMLMRRTTSVSEFAAADQGRQLAPAVRGASEAERGGLHRRYSGDFPVVETAAFLKACGLCKRRLGPGLDTFMYRGEVAFCSLECRQEQMNLDDHKEKKCSLTSMKDPPAGATGGSDQSGNSETLAAA